MEKMGIKTHSETETIPIESVGANDDHIRAKFSGKKDVLVMCRTYTTLYEPASPICLKCAEQTDCKTLLKEYYPALYDKRTKV